MMQSECWRQQFWTQAFFFQRMWDIDLHFPAVACTIMAVQATVRKCRDHRGDFNPAHGTQWNHWQEYE